MLRSDLNTNQLCRVLLRLIEGAAFVVGEAGAIELWNDDAANLLGTDGGSVPSVSEALGDDVAEAVRRVAGGEAPLVRDLGTVRVPATGIRLHVTIRAVDGSGAVVQGLPVDASDHDGEGEAHGFPAHDVLRELIEAMRSPIASIRAASETMSLYPEMDAAAASQFVSIIEQQTQILSRRLEASVDAYATAYREARPLDAMTGPSLRRLLADRLDQAIGVPVTEDGSGEDAEHDPAEVRETPTIRIDPPAILQMAEVLGRRVENAVRCERLLVAVRRVRGLVAVDLQWSGPQVSTTRLNDWKDERLSWGDTIVEMSVGEVLAHHAAQILTQPAGPGTHRLRILLPQATREVTGL